MKTDWSKGSLTSDSTKITADSYATTLTNSISINSDIYDGLRYAAQRRMEMEEKKAKGVGFDELAKILRKMGIFVTEIHQDSYNDYAEITCKVNPIDWYVSLDERNTNKYWGIPAKKKDSRLRPKKVIFCGPATTILWTDGTKTTVRCSSEDVWSDEVGIAMCYLKKAFGNKGNFNNIFREAMKVAITQPQKDRNAKMILEKIPHFDSAYDAVPEDYNFVEGKYEEETK